MHELSIAENIIKVITEQCKTLQIQPYEIVKVKIKIGKLTCVSSESLIFAFDIIKNEACLPNASLEIDSVPISIHCKICQKEYTLTENESVLCFLCPTCGSENIELLSGKELYIESIETNERN